MAADSAEAVVAVAATPKTWPFISHTEYHVLRRNALTLFVLVLAIGVPFWWYATSPVRHSLPPRKLALDVLDLAKVVVPSGRVVVRGLDINTHNACAEAMAKALRAHVSSGTSVVVAKKEAVVTTAATAAIAAAVEMKGFVSEEGDRNVFKGVKEEENARLDKSLDAVLSAAAGEVEGHLGSDTNNNDNEKKEMSITLVLMPPGFACGSAEAVAMVGAGSCLYACESQRGGGGVDGGSIGSSGGGDGGLDAVGTETRATLLGRLLGQMLPTGGEAAAGEAAAAATEQTSPSFFWRDGSHSHDIVLTLAHGDYLRIALNWDPISALGRYWPGLMRSLGRFGELHVTSQERAVFDTPPGLIMRDDTKSDGGGGGSGGGADMPPASRDALRHLPGLGLGLDAPWDTVTRKVVNFVVYTPPCRATPLRLLEDSADSSGVGDGDGGGGDGGSQQEEGEGWRDDNITTTTTTATTDNGAVNAFLVRDWGGVYIYNGHEAACKASAKNKRNNNNKVDDDRYAAEVDLVPALSAFRRHVLVLWGLEPSSSEVSTTVTPPALTATSSHAITAPGGAVPEWQIRRAMATRVGAHVASVANNVLLVLDMYRDFHKMPVPVQVANDLNAAIAAVKTTVRDLMVRGELTLAYKVARNAATMARRAAHHPDLLVLESVPSDQLYAIYVPFFLPTLAPVLQAARFYWRRG